jgi:hypothetical protein
MTYFVARDGRTIGQWSEAEFRKQIAAGVVLPTDYYWREGFETWRPAAAAIEKAKKDPLKMMILALFGIFMVFVMIGVSQRENKPKPTMTIAEREAVEAQAESDEVKLNLVAASHRVQIGMSKEQCRDAWGKPTFINRTGSAGGLSEQWVYRDSGRYLYFQ